MGVGGDEGGNWVHLMRKFGDKCKEVGVTYSRHTVLLPSPLRTRHLLCMKPLVTAAMTNAAMATPPQARATSSRELVEREVAETHKDDQKEDMGEKGGGGGGLGRRGV